MFPVQQIKWIRMKLTVSHRIIVCVKRNQPKLYKAFVPKHINLEI